MESIKYVVKNNSNNNKTSVRLIYFYHLDDILTHIFAWDRLNF